VYQMFDRTNLCPYTDHCESFQTITRAEKWMEHALSKLRREGSQGSSSYCGYSVEGLLWRLQHMSRVKDRCYSHNGRCLRFWQFRSKEEGEPTLQSRITSLLQHDYHREAPMRLITE